jgi:hypothetical protein
MKPLKHTRATGAVEQSWIPDYHAARMHRLDLVVALLPLLAMQPEGIIPKINPLHPREPRCGFVAAKFRPRLN